MRSLRNHLGVILPIVTLLFSIQFISLVENIIKNYEKLMSDDYNIIIVSQNDLNASVLKPLISDLASLEQLSSKSVMDRLSRDVSAKNISILQNALPKFYSLKLSSFPGSEQMETIKSKILNVRGVSKVETFTKTHDKVHKSLKLIKKISEIFSVLIVVTGFMLMLKQMRIWLYEHRERIEIMTLFGAPFWLKSAVLYKIAIFDSIFGATLVTVFYMFLPEIEIARALVSEIDMSLPTMDIGYDGLKLFGIALFLSIFCVSLVMRKAKKSSL